MSSVGLPQVITTETVDTIIEVDASGVPIKITYPPAVAGDTGRSVTIVKVDDTTNAVDITADGVDPIDVLVTAANGGQVEARNVWSDGGKLASSVGGPSGDAIVIPVDADYTISPVDNVITTITPGTSGTYDFGGIAASELALDIFERIQWRAATLTPDMLESAYRSFNLAQVVWSNRGVNLWQATPFSITLLQGVATYQLPSTWITILPSPYIRTWNLSLQNNLMGPFTTIVGSTTVTVNLPSNGLSVGNMVNVATPAAVGGIVLFGYYPVISTPTTNSFTLTAASLPTSAVTGGTVPTFTTTQGLTSVTVALTNQPFLAGQTFNVQVATQVGGLTLNGQYLITSASTNSFVIDATLSATSAQTVTMNSGDVLIQTNPNDQAGTAFFDQVLYPLSRDDYTSLPNKFIQGRPTSFWFNKQTNPTITFWPVPDGQCYQNLGYYQSQQQDAKVNGYTLIDIPYRFVEGYCAAVAAHLAMKWRPERFAELSAYAQQMWMEASDADREQVSWYVSPNFQGYFQ